MINCRTILLLVSLAWSMGPCSAQSAEMTPQEALHIVNEELRASGHNVLPSSGVTVRAYDALENDCLQHFVEKSEIDKAVQSLRGRRYFLVMYLSPPDILFSRPFCAFVDRDTRTLINVDLEN
jgi:hypothetical protein